MYSAVTVETWLFPRRDRCKAAPPANADFDRHGQVGETVRKNVNLTLAAVLKLRSPTHGVEGDRDDKTSGQPLLVTFFLTVFADLTVRSKSALGWRRCFTSIASRNNHGFHGHGRIHRERQGAFPASRDLPALRLHPRIHGPFLFALRQIGGRNGRAFAVRAGGDLRIRNMTALTRRPSFAGGLL